MGEKFQRVEIEMTAEQQAEGRREVSRYRYTGTLLIRDETVYISYEEEMEDDRYRTLLTCRDGRLTMSRKGSGRQRMEFVPGERRPAVYETPVGTLPLEVLTEKCALEQDKGGMDIAVDYELFSGGTPMARHRLVVEIRYI